MSIAIGIDGCSRGWFFFRYDGGAVTFGVRPAVEEILAGVPADACSLVDIPIGLRDRGRRERDCDVEAREVLAAKRKPSVFPVPCRQAVYAGTYREAARINRKVLGRSLSKQSWNIIPKIREVDSLLKRSETARSILREAHPEVCFWGLAGGSMTHSKRTREGFAERMRILQLFDPDAERLLAAAFFAHGGYEAARDDLVDAFVLGLCARRAGELVTMPEAPRRDRRGLPMAISWLPGPGRG